MKTIRSIGVVLLTVLLSVGFSACGGSDDEDDGGDSSAAIEGVWYLKSEYSFKWDANTNSFDKSKVYDEETYPDYERKYTYTFTKIANGYQLKYTDGYDDWYGLDELVDFKDGAYDLYEIHKSDNRKELVGKAYVTSYTSNRMTIEYEETGKIYYVQSYMR